MVGAKIVLVSGILMAGAVPLQQTYINTKFNERIPFVSKGSHIKEEVVFNNGNLKIFRTFDENGKQILNQDDGNECVDL